MKEQDNVNNKLQELIAEIIEENKKNGIENFKKTRKKIRKSILLTAEEAEKFVNKLKNDDKTLTIEIVDVHVEEPSKHIKKQKKIDELLKLIQKAKKQGRRK